MTRRRYDVTVEEDGTVLVAECRGLWQPAVALPPRSTVGFTLAVILDEVVEMSKPQPTPAQGSSRSEVMDR